MNENQTNTYGYLILAQHKSNDNWYPLNPTIFHHGYWYFHEDNAKLICSFLQSANKEYEFKVIEVKE